MDRRHVGELRRDLDERLRDEDGDRVEVRGIGGESQALGLERDRAAAAKRVEDGRRVAAGGAADLRAGFLEDHLVRCVLPQDQALDDPEEAGPLVLDCLRRREAVGIGGWVVDEAGEEHGSAGCKWPAGPPEVERARVAVADALLARRRDIDRLERQGDLDELALDGRRHASLDPPTSLNT
jgi:hypothetical protein